jgi:hypothetical protein
VAIKKTPYAEWGAATRAEMEGAGEGWVLYVDEDEDVAVAGPAPEFDGDLIAIEIFDPEVRCLVEDQEMADKVIGLIIGGDDEGDDDDEGEG